MTVKALFALPSLHDYDVKIPNFTFYGGLKQALSKLFIFLYLKFGCASRNSTPGKINKYATFSLPMPSSDLKVPKRLFKNFPMHQNDYSNVNVVLNITEISKVSESCLTEVVHFNKIVHSGNPTFNRVFQSLRNALTTQ